MAKRKAKKKSKGKGVEACCAPMPSENESRSVRVRKISNGYVVSKSSSGPKGYKDEEIFTASKPSIEMQVKESKAREKRLEKVKL